MSRDYEFVTVDVFTSQRFGGNPLAVLPDARELGAEEMQALAAEFNLSETTFVLPPEDPSNSARVRIFTPRAELPFAGHPTVGTAWVLATRGLDRDGVLLFEQQAGLVRVEVERQGELVAGARIAAPQPLSVAGRVPADAVAPCAGLSASDFLGDVVIASVGTPFPMAPVTPEALSRAAPDVAAFRALAATPGGVREIYLYARDGGTVRARLFAPLMGIPEDPATGSAGAALVALLLQGDGGDALDVTISQGAEMGRPSLLRAEARRAADGIHAFVGGDCVLMMEGRIRL